MVDRFQSYKFILHFLKKLINCYQCITKIILYTVFAIDNKTFFFNKVDLYLMSKQSYNNIFVSQKCH